MQMVSTQKLSYALVAVFSLGLASFALAASHGGDGGPLADADTNGDGVISQEEFQAKRSRRFSEADADGTGGLNLEEFTAMREQRETERRARRTQRMFNNLDSNGDGVVDEAELAAKTDKMFSRIDADGDGSITTEEMKQHRMARHHGGHRGPKGMPGDVPGHMNTPLPPM